MAMVLGDFLKKASHQIAKLPRIMPALISALRLIKRLTTFKKTE